MHCYATALHSYGSDGEDCGSLKPEARARSAEPWKSSREQAGGQRRGGGRDPQGRLRKEPRRTSSAHADGGRPRGGRTPDAAPPPSFSTGPIKRETPRSDKQPSRRAARLSVHLSTLCPYLSSAAPGE